ncbi:MAG: phage protease, partial [Gallionella sp.]|nr:phage protease [Gallionella sp.]
MATKTTKTRTQPGIGIAVCSVALNGAGELQLMPAGAFRGIDGRPADASQWVINAEIAANVIAFNSTRETPLVLDYEHQTMLKEQNGQPAPAAGWFSGSDLVWREGEGLFTKVELTQRARDYIAADEYRFVSPVFYYRKGTGEILGLHSAALTNTPNIDGMAELAIAAASQALDGASIEITEENTSMDIEDLLEDLRWMLNLPKLATPEEVAAELQKAIALIKQGGGEAAVAANTMGVFGLFDARRTQLVALNQAQADLQAAQAELSSLKGANAEREVADVVEAALAANKLLPAQKDAALALGKSNLAALNQMIAAVTPLAALTQLQTGGNAPAGALDANNATALAAAAQKFMDA